MRIAIIPARGGSKRIPRKNIKPFAGKPIIAYSIGAANASSLFDKVLVSTDDDEIAHVARSFNAIAPFVRPADLADDHTGTTAVVNHALEWMRRQGHSVDAACCIYATAPFISIEDLRTGLCQLERDALDFVFTAARFPSPPQRGLLVAPGGGVVPLFSEHRETRSQDLPPVFHDAAQFYWGTADAWTAQRPIFDVRSSIIELPQWRVQDIDTPEDWAAAERMFEAQQRQERA